MKFEHCIVDYGAQNGEDSTGGIQAAIDACCAAGGGRVLVTPGEWRISSITLYTGVELHIAQGAMLTGIFYAESNRRALIYAKGANDIAITGFGKINGESPAYVIHENEYHRAGGGNRPKIILLENCRNVRISGITIENAPEWTFHPIGCENMYIDGIQIFNDLRMANSDGIDPDHCKNVHITNCTIRCADDCIVLKNSRDYQRYGDCRDIFISGCNLTSTSAALKIGSETWGRFANVIVSDCVIRDSNRGIGIQLRDNGSVENMLIQNVIIETRYFYERYWGKGEAIWITNIPRNADDLPGRIENVVFRNIIIRSEGSIFVQGTRKGDIRNIVFEDMDVTMYKASKWDGGLYDRRPVAMPMPPRQAFVPGDESVARSWSLSIGAPDEHLSAHVFRDKANALRLENAEAITVRNVRTRFEGDQPYFGDALRAINVQGLALREFLGEVAHAADSAVSVDNTTIL